jgi:SPP1 gp7 family putative phage head morphogenesis protein
MPTAVPDNLKMGSMTPADAAAAFQRRGELLPSFRWQDVFQQEHGRGVAVAGVSRLDILKIYQDELDLTIKEGRSLKDFSDRIRPRLVAEGWWGDIEVTNPATGESRITRFNDNRLRTIFEVNMRQSHAAGRWQRIERLKKRFPFVMYRTMRDERVRTSHRPWNGVCLPVDDPWWNTHYPPCGWRCRCTAFSLDAAELERRQKAGEDVKTTAPPVDWITYVNPATGEVVPVPRGIDPGFAYNPGKLRDQGFFETALRKAAASSPLAGAVAVAEATLANPAMQRQATERFAAWVDEVVARGQGRGELKYIAAMAPTVVRGLEAGGYSLRSAALAVRDTDVLHTLRPTKPAEVRLPDEVYRQLPDLLRNPSAVLREMGTEPPVLFYVVDMPQANGSVAKLVVKVDEPVKTKLEGKRTTVPVNVVRTVTVMNPQALGDRTRYELLWGKL